MRILLLTTLMIFSCSASAGLYKWVDDEGNVHYSQKPPLEQKYKRLKAPAPAPAPENSQSPYPSTSKNIKKDVTATETAKNKKLRDLNCARAKKHLNTYQVYSRIRGKDGTIKIISDEERARETQKAQQSISDFCD